MKLKFLFLVCYSICLQASESDDLDKLPNKVYCNALKHYSKDVIGEINSEQFGPILGKLLLFKTYLPECKQSKLLNKLYQEATTCNYLALRHRLFLAMIQCKQINDKFRASKVKRQNIEILRKKFEYFSLHI